VAKTLLYRLFGLGKIPVTLRATLDSERVLALDEGIKGSVTYLDFRAPGKYSSWRRIWFTAAVVITHVRLVALQNTNLAINVPFTDERIRSLRFSAEKTDTLLIAFDASLFHPDWSGTMEYRFRTAEAGAFIAKLGEMIN
jgi:hypothetical protein